MSPFGRDGKPSNDNRHPRLGVDLTPSLEALSEIERLKAETGARSNTELLRKLLRDPDRVVPTDGAD